MFQGVILRSLSFMMFELLQCKDINGCLKRVESKLRGLYLSHSYFRCS